MMLDVANQDNFVMLCPLHASSKLPSEYLESQERKKSCSANKYGSFPQCSKFHDQTLKFPIK